MIEKQPSGILYIFLDEGGNFDFSQTGTSYFTLTSVAMQRLFMIREAWDNNKYDLLEFGKNLEYFYCADDNQHIRNRIFTILKRMPHHCKLTV